MTRWHNSPKDGQARVCTAAEGKCPFGGEHYDSFKEAAIASVERELLLQERSTLPRFNEDEV